MWAFGFNSHPTDPEGHGDEVRAFIEQGNTVTIAKKKDTNGGTCPITTKKGSGVCGI
jgi:hypothetical protein